MKLVTYGVVLALVAASATTLVGADDQSAPKPLRTSATVDLRGLLTAAGHAPDAAALTADVRRARETLATDACAAAEALRSAAARSATSAPDLSRSANGLRGQILGGIPADEGCDGPVAVYVDPTKSQPHATAIPGFEGTTRPLASLIDTDGVRSDFVNDELVVGSTDEAAVVALAVRWGGKVTHSIDGPVKGAERQYLVRIDPNRADPAGLSDKLAALNGEKSKAASLAVSSDTGLRLLAAVATEETAPTAGSMKVGVNWVAEPQGFDDGSTVEAIDGPPGFTDQPNAPYSRDAFDWNHLNSGSVQDIGVTDSWALLESTGRTSNKIGVGIIDQGFRPVSSNELPEYLLLTSIPGVDPQRPGPDDAPWHGTDVASVATAIPDNGWGSAGTGGPVAKATMVWSTLDIFLTMSAISVALAYRSTVINMSFSARVHWSLVWSLLPFEAYTFTTRQAGVLLFAASGNDGEDVDRESCRLIIACWESHWHSPCENAGVLCVGGLESNGLDADWWSNYGSEQVDIFAPGTLIAGPNPEHPGNRGHLVQGTSAAAPYAAGVAALIWAASPGSSASTVERILLANMRTSPDTKVRRKVIHALGAVREALPAVIRIVDPRDGGGVSAGARTRLRAEVYDDGHGTPTVTWRLGSGATLGTGNPMNAVLPPGEHDLIATATFPDGASATDRIRITATNSRPVVGIVAPSSTDGQPPVFGRSEPITFRATSNDPGIGQLPDNQVSWYLDSLPVPFTTGHLSTAVLPVAPGDHVVSVRGCDAYGECATASVTIRIRADPPDQPPQVRITNPTGNSHLSVNVFDGTTWYHELTLGAQVTDPEGGPVSLVWYDNGTQVATGPSPIVRLRGGCEFTPHRITLVATDNAGNRREDAVEVTVVYVC